MNKDEFLDYHKNCCDYLVDLTRKKNKDYSGNNDNPFFNYESTERLNVTSTEKGFLVRMLDKYNRINSFIEQGVFEVEDEKIEDTLLDLANYSIMMSAYIKHKKNK
jgi:hypothetical protein